MMFRCKEEMRPFPPVIESIYFKSLDMRLLLNILTETQVYNKIALGLGEGFLSLHSSFVC